LHAGVAFVVEATAAFGEADPRGDTGRVNVLKLLQAGGQSLEGTLTVGMLRTALGGHHNKSAWSVQQAHAGFYFVAVLAAGSACDNVFHIAITLKR
jgi:hypothetical protein